MYYTAFIEKGIVLVDALNLLEHECASYIHTGALEGITWGSLDKIELGEWFWRESVVYYRLNELNVLSSNIFTGEEKQASDIGWE